MDPCHSVTAIRSPARTSAVTVAHLIRNIEQLKNKDKLISQLEKDLGHQWVSAHQAALERAAVTSGPCWEGNCDVTKSAGQSPLLPGATSSGLGGGQHQKQQKQQQQHKERNMACGGSSTPSSGCHPAAVSSALPPLAGSIGEEGEDTEDEPTGLPSRTPSSTAATGSVEDVWSSPLEGSLLSKQDLQKALKASKERNKELVEKCRAYLHRTKDLTAQNRAYKDSSVKLLEENKKMQELLEHSKLRCLQLNRAADAAGAERTWAQQTSQVVEQARAELTEAHKTIAALRQACSDKDRRIELIQHRKKRRRLATSSDNRSGETYFGYDEETNSMDSSLSRSTMSDEDCWDELLSREETERNYQRLMMEHMKLQKSYAKLQNQTANLQDPQREEKAKDELQNDLFESQCRIEMLEKLLGELGEGEVRTLLKEREIMMSDSRALKRKLECGDKELTRVQKELAQMTRRAEDLEFQLIEIEQQAEDRHKNPQCLDQSDARLEVSKDQHEGHLLKEGNEQQRRQPHLSATPPRSINQGGDKAEAAEEEEEEEKSGGRPAVLQVACEREWGDGEDSPANREQSEGSSFSGWSGSSGGFQLLLASLLVQRQRLAQETEATKLLVPDMEQLKADLAALLKGKGRQAESALKRLDNITTEEKKRCEALEYMANELQMKVINLQQEMDSPQAKSSKGQKSGKADNSLTDAQAREKQENLELKEQVENQTLSNAQLVDKENRLLNELDDWKSRCVYFQHQVDLLSQPQHTAGRIKPHAVSETGVQTFSPISSPAKPSSPPLAELTRKNSKDRKSRPRSGDDPTATKRRRSSHDNSPSYRLRPCESRMKTTKSAGDIKSMAFVYEPPGGMQMFTQRSTEKGEERLLGSSAAENMVSDVVEERMEAEVDHNLEPAPVARMDFKTASFPSLEATAPSLPQHKWQNGYLRDEEDSVSDASSCGGGSLGTTSDLEDLVEHLKGELVAREIAERQLRERLRLVEAGAEEAEAAELSTRDKYEALLATEAENSKQLRQMQYTYRELRDILMEKEIVEQALTDKVDFLQRAEAAAVKRVDELEAEVKELSIQLEEAARAAEEFDPTGTNQRELNKIQELKHQLTFLETDNKALQARVAELEENEETLRENWRKVAEEDFSRIKGLEEKVKCLEDDLSEAQEYYVINTMPGTSLAAELADSQADLDGPDDTKGSQGVTDVVDGQGFVENPGLVRKDSEKVSLRDRVKTLEKQLSDVAEKKNTTIENLQEKIGALKENEIKLSETISEMEMTEREIRAKLALYESSEVTVEKMLKYQSKIEELRTSQESLLDQIEAMESQEMTTQEQMQEMERTLRGKIVTLEVEMRGYKTRELKDAGRIRELEKQEKELSEKTTQQAEKENGLYVKISALMEENKAAKEQLESLKVQLADKEDKVRKAKLLEVKFLEIEMEFSKKMSDLSSKLRYKEEELRQKEVAHEEEMRAMKEEFSSRDSEHGSKQRDLERKISERETEMVKQVGSLEQQLGNITSEKNAYESQLKDATDENKSLRLRQAELEREVGELKDEVSALNSFEKESQHIVTQLQESLELEKSFTEEAENKVKSLLEDVSQSKEKIAGLESQIASLKSELAEKSKKADVVAEKENDWEQERQTVAEELKFKTERINELEGQIEEQGLKLVELENKIQSMEEQHQQKVDSLEEEQKILERELLNQVMFLNTQLSNEVQTRESEKSALKQSNQREESLSAEINKLQKELESHKTDLVEKLSELEAKNKENCELSLQLSNSKHSSETLRYDYQILKDSSSEAEKKFRKEISEKESEISTLRSNLDKSQSDVQRMQEQLLRSDSLVQEASSEKHKLVQEMLMEEKIVKEQFVQEHIQKSDSAVLQCKQDHQTEVESLAQKLSEEEEKVKKAYEEIEALAVRSEDLESQIQTLELYLSEVNFKLDSKSSLCRKREEELEKVKADHDTSKTEKDALRQQLNELQSQLDGKNVEIAQKQTESSDSLSLASAKQQELEHARSELQKCLQEIEHYKIQVNNDKDELNAKDQEQCRLKDDYDQLKQQCHERGKEYEQKESSLEFKLKEAENRYRELEAKYASLEMQYEERFAQAQQGDKVLRATENERDKILLKLENLEKEYLTLTQKLEESEISLGEKQDECKTFETIYSALEVEKKDLEQKLGLKCLECEELDNELLEVKSSSESQLSELTALRLNCDNIKGKLAKTELELKDTERRQEQLRVDLRKAEECSSASAQQVAELQGTLQFLQETLDKKETSHKEEESGRLSLEQQLFDVKIENQNINSKLSFLQSMHDQNKTLLHQKEGEVEELNSILERNKAELLDLQNQLSEQEGTCAGLETEVQTLKEKSEQNEEKSIHLQKTIKGNESYICDLEQRVDSVKDEIDAKEIELKSLKSDYSKLQVENTTLRTDLEQLSEEYDGLEASKIQAEDEMKTISTENKKLLADVSDLQKELSFMQEEKANMFQKCAMHQHDVEDLQKKLQETHSVERNALESRLQEAESMCQELMLDLDRFKEEMAASANTVADLDDQLREKKSENAILKSELFELEKSMQSANEEKEMMKAMEMKIETFQRSDSAKEEKLDLLEKELAVIKDREQKLSQQVTELEGKEKDLLEQMADIEATVIVPLETENQELKDELGIMQQERDEALARMSKWDGYDEQEPEAVHKKLQEALEQREELEKKVDILMADIGKLEADRDSLNRKITDLHASHEDLAEKCEIVEFDNERLREMERQSSVVEESETRLMDRVLDLEEREHQLTAELKELKEKEVNSTACQTEEGMLSTQSYADMEQKLKYLEQKVEVLKDAESKYVENIMELEEVKAALQTKLNEQPAIVNSPAQITMSSSSRNMPSVNQDQSASMTYTNYASTTFTSYSNIDSENHHEMVYRETVDQVQSKTVLEADHDSVASSVREKLPDSEFQTLQKEKEELVQQLEESASKLKALEKKVELLQDSEAKLMERLLETEEQSQRIQAIRNLHENEMNVSNNELRKKLDTLTEENEFLAESVENFKQLYKEEREKSNTLQERALEDSSLFHELEEARAELVAMHSKIDDLRVEQAQQLADQEERETALNSMLEQGRHRETELHQQLLNLQESEDHFHRACSDLDTKNGLMQDNISELESRVAELTNKEQNLQQERVTLHREATHQQQQLSASLNRVKDLEQHVQGLEQEVQKLRNHLSKAHQGPGVVPVSSHMRSDSRDSSNQARSPSPVAEENFAVSTASLILQRPPGAPSPSQQSGSSASSYTHSTQLSGLNPAHSLDSSYDDSPVAPPRPRGRKSRPTSIDSVSQEELMFLVEELQAREAALKRRIVDLESVTDSTDLSQRVDELESENRQLKKNLQEQTQSLSQTEAPVVALHRQTLLTHQRASPQADADGSYVSLSNPSYYFPGGDSNNNSSALRDNNAVTAAAAANASGGRSGRDSANMLDKPGDVLQQRIKELERLDEINKNQLSELERDREVLHEIARKDKATIHDLNVRIRELQLSERSLREQVNSLEVSESSLFSRCEDLDDARSRLEDRVHELEVHERRLRELVRRLKLDEERWLGRSGGMETALGELSASEIQLKRMLQDAELEKGGLAERMSYMEARVKELEAVELSLTHQVKALQNSEANLQDKLSQLENSEAAAHSKAAELDVLNADLTQRLQAGLEERAMLGQHMQQLHGQIQELDRRLLTSRDSELAYKQHVESLQKNESCLQKRVREFELREIDSQAKVRELEQMQDILRDKMAALQRSENRLKYRVQELEGMGGQVPGELTPTQRQKLPQNLEDCQKQVVVLQNHVESLQMQLRENLKQSQKKLASMDNTETVAVPVSELSHLRARSTLLEESSYQLQEVERVNQELNDTILKLREGKGASGYEVEVEVLKRRLASYKACIDKLKSSLSAGQATSLVDPELDSGPDGETLPARHLRGLESERVLQSVRGMEDKKANGLPGTSKHGLTAQESSMVRSKSVPSVSSAPVSVEMSFAEDSSTDVDHQVRSSVSVKPDQEENHWRAIEARRVGSVASLPRGGGAMPNTAPPNPALHTGDGRTNSELETSKYGADTDGWVGNRAEGGAGAATPEVEEVTVALHLQSESELSSHHQHHRLSDSHHSRTEYLMNQNDTDSSLSPVPPPRRLRKTAGTKGAVRREADSNSDRHSRHSSSNDSGDDGVYNLNNNNSSDKSGEDMSDSKVNSNNGNMSPHPPADDIVAATTNQKLFFGNGQKKPLPHSNLPTGAAATVADGENTYPASQSQSPRPPLASFGGQESFHLPSSTRDRVDSFEDEDGPPPPLPSTLPPGTENQEQGSRKASSDSQGAGSGKDSLDASTSGLSIRQRIAMIEKQLLPDQFDSKVVSNQEELWKTQVSEKSKQVELLDRDNKYLKEEITKLERELEEKRRHIHTLETWLSSVDDLLKNKNKQTDREMVEQLQLDLTKLRAELKKVGHRPEGDQMDPAALRTELEHRDREIVSKRSELQNLAQELKQCKAECRSIEGMRRTALDSLRDLEQEVVELQEKETRLIEAEEELEELRRRTEKTREVYEENILLRDKVHQGELELRRLRNLCDDFNNLSARYEELENDKQQAVDMIQPLQAKLERLARKCQQKDALLLDLGDELRNNPTRQSQALDELDRMTKIMSLEEYNTDFPQMTNGLPVADRTSQGNLRKAFSRSSSMEELDQHFNTQAPPRERRKRPAPQPSDRPHSADGILGSDRRRRVRNDVPEADERVYLQSRASLHHMDAPSYHKNRTDQRGPGGMAAGGRYRAIADYDPSLFSQSGRPGLELELVEGDIVTVTGPIDRTGYYEAEVKGRAGLVPANYLLPLHQPGSATRLHRSGFGSQPGVNQSPEHILDMFNQLQQQGSLPQASSASRKGPGQPHEAWPASKSPSQHYQGSSSVPDPPCNLHVKESGDEAGLFLLSWQPPRLDAHGCSNGLQVLGYMVYVDNKEYEQVPSAGLCEVVLEGLSPGQSHALAVQCLCGNGQASACAQILFQGIQGSQAFNQGLVHQRIVGQGHRDGKNLVEKATGGEDDVDDVGSMPDTDLSSVLNRVHYRKGQKRKVLALYDYNPSQESPGDYPHLELAFQAGDIMIVYGDARPDGFLHGEVDGKRGLVPACFVEDVAESQRGGQRVPTGAGEMSA